MAKWRMHEEVAKSLWRVREKEGMPGKFVVVGNVDGREFTTSSMPYQKAFEIAWKANSELLLHARPILEISRKDCDLDAQIAKAKGGA